MLSPSTLPLQFLLPAWTVRQLSQTAHVVQRGQHGNGQQRRAHNQSIAARKQNNRKSESESISGTATPELSLFERLFPEESEVTRKAAERRLERLPAFKWHGDFHGDTSKKEKPGVKSLDNGSLKGPSSWSHQHPPVVRREVMESRSTREPSVLVLSAVSKTLEESDFFRLSPKGEHIEGWTSGILRVIPARDPKTLEPLGYYYLLFANEPAARAYLDNMIRLHKISRVSGSMRDPFLTHSHKHLLRPSEDLKSLIKGFTLLPTSGRLSLRLLGKPYTPHVSNIVKYGGLKSLAEKENKAENMVLLWSEEGSWSEFEVRDALGEDGRRRNLPWKLMGLERDIVSLNRDQLIEDEENADDTGGSQRTKMYRRPARYTIAFKDRHEARRFVREWHRRPFPGRKGRIEEGEEPPIINVEILW